MTLIFTSKRGKDKARWDGALHAQNRRNKAKAHPMGKAAKLAQQETVEDRNGTASKREGIPGS